MAADVRPAPIPRHEAPRGWRERWLGFRNRLIAKPSFQRWAAGFPLTRGVARRRARALFDLVAGFVYAQVLAAGVQLNLFAILAEGPQTVAALAPRLALSEAAAERLLKAAAALELAELLPDGRFGLGHLGAALLGNPALPPMIAHHAMLYADLADPVALLRGQGETRKLADFWAYGSGDAGPYSRLMAESQSLVAREILDAYPLGQHRRLMDIGGGEGAFLTAAGTRHAALELVLADLPEVAEKGLERLQMAGLGGRSSAAPGSFLADPLPHGADVASLVRVLHDHDDAAAMVILRRARAALPPGGVLLVAEPMAGAPGAAPMGDAYFGFYLLAMGSGRPRTPKEISAMLAAAGFGSSRLLRTRQPLVVQVIAARV
jgi:demethylspheroidene O-methyltransferase